ncbi:substrate-binding domain-containing protein [Shewanella sp. VB17]|uniref:substrate-binding domain-containing protein n=1 Tax=Shewanella sp. VB17 TaxID=2739432 RepID=UPI001566A024|nr:substrate-binding domain-containing protein [Shewanella sp. VB17]NRD73756.1 substrate-binding domain-containing protein [Shewanella sp. VB17]
MQYNFYLLFYCLLLSTPLMTRADNLRFALIPKETNNPFFIASGEGCKFAAKKLGNVECIFQGSANIDVRAQDKIISDLIDTGVDGIAVAISQSEFLASHSIKKAIEHQIPVITYDADFDPQTLKKYQHLRLSYIGSDDFELGKALGEQLTLYRPNGGVLAIQSGRPDSPNLNLRVMGVRSALSGKLYSTAPGERLNGDNGWTEISQPLYNFGQFDKALEDLKTVLNLYQDQKIDSFVAVGGWPQFIEGYRDIVEPYKLDIERKDIVVIIGDSAKIQRQYLQEHLAHANIGQNPFEMGKQAIFTLYKIVNKQKYEKQIMTPLTYCTQDNYRTCTGKN